MRLPKAVEQLCLGKLRGNTLLVVLSSVMALPFGLHATPSLTKLASPNPFPGLVDIRSTGLAIGTIVGQGSSATPVEEASSNGSTSANQPTEGENIPAEHQPSRPKGWQWEKATLFHFTNPASRPGIAGSRAGQKLGKEFDLGLDLLAESLDSDVHAIAHQQESLAGLGEVRSGFEDLPTSVLPEPPPFVLFATGLACVLISLAVRRFRKTNY